MSKTSPMHRLRGLLLCSCVLALAAGCASSKAARGVEVEGPGVDDKPTAGGKPAAGGAPVAGGKQQDAPQVSNRAKLLFEDAVKAMEASKKGGKADYAALERKFQAAADADERLAEASYNLGVLAEKQGKKDEAIAHYKTALRKKPSLTQAAENLAVIAQNGGDVAGAVQIYTQILEHYPDDSGSRARLAEIYRQTGDHDRAMEYARGALVRDPKNITANKVMMNVFLERKQLAMARLVALRAMKLDEGDPELYFTVGQILEKENEPAKARIQYQKAVEARPDFQPAHATLARMALKAEDYPGAEEHLRRLLQTNSKSAELHLNLGVAYKGMGQFDKAMQEYDTAEKLNPELAGVYLNRGIILHRHKGAPERGLELYRKYIALRGGDVSLDNDAPVFGLIKEAEATVQQKDDEKRAVEEAERMEKAQKAQEAEMKAAEAKEKKGAASPEGAAEEGAAAGEKGEKPGKKAAPPPAAAEKAPEKSAPPTPAAPVPKPAAKPKPSDEPGEEPGDAL